MNAAPEIADSFLGDVALSEQILQNIYMSNAAAPRRANLSKLRHGHS